MSDAKTRAGLLEVFCRDVSKTPLLTVAQERRLARAVREGGVRLRAKARAILVESNLRLVFSISTHFTGRGLDLPDLVQEGMVGLITAAERYDERRGTRFSTYACPQAGAAEIHLAASLHQRDRHAFGAAVSRGRAGSPGRGG